MTRAAKTKRFDEKLLEEVFRAGLAGLTMNSTAEGIILNIHGPTTRRARDHLAGLPASELNPPLTAAMNRLLGGKP